MHYLNPKGAIPLVPVSMNCTVPPLPTPERAYQVGGLMREMVRAFPEDLRVAVLATGGLSHEPGGPRYFWVDEVFDRWFLERLQAGDHGALLRECTLERMEEAGSGGTRSSWRGSSCWPSPGGRPRCSPTCRRWPGVGHRHGRLERDG